MVTLARETTHNVEMYVKTVKNQQNQLGFAVLTNANNITCITRRKVTKLYKLRTNARAFYTKRKFSRRNVCTVESIHSTAIWVRINTGILSSCKVVLPKRTRFFD